MLIHRSPTVMGFFHSWIFHICLSVGTQFCSNVYCLVCVKIMKNTLMFYINILWTGAYIWEAYSFLSLSFKTIVNLMKLNFINPDGIFQTYNWHAFLVLDTFHGAWSHLCKIISQLVSAHLYDIIARQREYRPRNGYPGINTASPGSGLALWRSNKLFDIQQM